MLRPPHWREGYLNGYSVNAASYIIGVKIARLIFLTIETTLGEVHGLCGMKAQVKLLIRAICRYIVHANSVMQAMGPV